MSGLVSLASNARWTEPAPTWPERPDWQARAACRDLPTDLFFPGRGEDQELAIEACQRCPVRAECLEHALRYERHGIWAGTSEKDRKAMRKRMGIRLIELTPVDDTDGPDDIEEEDDEWQ